MLIINRKETDPYFNLATEEYVLKNFEDDCFMLWRNEPSVIVGKHQNTLAEINYDFVRSRHMKVVRRISGGGTVFHDLGNINFTFVMNGDKDQLVDFRRFTKPIIEVMATLGIDARFEGRNDLTIEGKKFSGNAEHVYKNRVLHHGTMLFNAAINDLSDALKVDQDKFTDKAVKSVRSRVTNICEHLREPISIDEFIKLNIQHILNTFTGTTLYELSFQDRENILELVRTKYATWEWNFGYSPRYNFSKSIKTHAGKVEFNFEVQQGVIKQVRIRGDFFNKADIEDIENALIGIPHREKEMLEILKRFEISQYFNNFTLEDLIPALF